jgi:Xaa-Pro aminopeptidase
MRSDRSILANVERLERLLDRDGLDAVVARSGTNFTYMAGFAYPGTLARHLDFADSPRGVCVVWPRRGEPIMVLNPIAAPLARRDSWLTEIHEYGGYAESVYVALAGVIRELGLASSRIGLEMSFISAADWRELAKALPEAELVNCAAMMHEVRAVKTADEVALIREAAGLLDQVYLDVFRTVHEHDTERSVHSRMVAACLECGAGWAHGILNSSRNTVLYGGESDVTFEIGDVIRTDYVLWYRGYPGHQSRVAVLGEPTPERSREYRAVRDIYRSAVSKARPGAVARDIFEFARRGFSEAGLSGMPPIAGHGVGCWWHQQPPYIVSGDQSVLEPGMVVAFEPHIAPYHIQDMVLVTEDAPENLSPLFDTDEMLVVG